mgnify:CR=1 FL=1
MIKRRALKTNQRKIQRAETKPRISQKINQRINPRRVPVKIRRNRGNRY